MVVFLGLPDVLLWNILDLTDLSTVSRISATCRGLHEVISPRLQQVQLLLDEKLPETETGTLLQIWKSVSIILPSIFADPFTTMRLYVRCEAGRGPLDVNDILCLSGRVHPVILGAFLAYQPSDNRALQDLLTVVASENWASRRIPNLSYRIEKRIRKIVSKLPPLPETLNGNICQDIRCHLQHLGPPYCHIFPHNELVAKLLLEEFHRIHAFHLLNDRCVVLALCCRGIRFNAHPFLSDVAPHINPKLMRDIFPTLRFDNNAAGWISLLAGTLFRENISPAVFSYAPEICRRLYCILACLLMHFPWTEFCTVVLRRNEYWPPNCALISETLLNMARKAYGYQNNLLARCLMSCAAKQSLPDPESQFDIVRRSSAWRRSGLQGLKLDQLQSLDMIWTVLDLDVDLGSLFPYFLRRPDVRTHLRSSQFELLQRLIRRAMQCRRRFYLDSLEYFVDIPEFVGFLESNMTAYVYALGESFLDRPGAFNVEWSERSVQPPAALLLAMKLPFWSKLVTLPRSKHGATLLHMAYFYQHSGAVNLLLSCLHSVRDCVDSQGHGPLYYYLLLTPNMDSFGHFLHQLPLLDPSYHPQIAADFEQAFRRAAVWSQCKVFLEASLGVEFMRGLMLPSDSILRQHAIAYGFQHLIPN